jgi:diamine N-acetyltransferase
MTETESIFSSEGEIKLRPVEKEDAEFLQELILHKGVRKTIGKAPKPVSKKDSEEFIEERSSNESHESFLIMFRDEKAGEVSVHGLDIEYRRGDFGISIHPDFQGQGIGTTAVKLVLQYAFETMNLHKMRGGYLDGNEASKRIMEKNGFQEEGVERHYKYVDGEWKDAHWMSILREEYDNDQA